MVFLVSRLVLQLRLLLRQLDEVECVRRHLALASLVLVLRPGAAQRLDQVCVPDLDLLRVLAPLADLQLQDAEVLAEVALLNEKEGRRGWADSGTTVFVARLLFALQTGQALRYLKHVHLCP